MSSLERNKDLVRQFLDEVWNTGNIQAFGRYIAPRYTIHHDPGDPWDKRELSLEQYMRRVTVSRAPFPDQSFTVLETFAETDKVAITWTWNATHQGDIPGFPATGNAINMSGATIYYVDSGKFTGHWQISDRLGVFMQLRQGLASQ